MTKKEEENLSVGDSLASIKVNGKEAVVLSTGKKIEYRITKHKKSHRIGRTYKYSRRFVRKHYNVVDHFSKISNNYNI